MTTRSDRAEKVGSEILIDTVDGDLAGLRPTRQRRAVVHHLDQAGSFLSAYAVHEALEASGVDVGLSTIYRSLEALSERGAIDAIRGPGGEMLYRKCANQPHDHLVCRDCGAAVEVQGEAISQLVAKWADAAGFAEVQHTLEVFGTCPKCRR